MTVKEKSQNRWREKRTNY